MVARRRYSRRSPNPSSTGEVYPGSEYPPDVREFMLAMQSYKEQAARPFPTWREVLAVVKSLGYRKPGEVEKPPEETPAPELPENVGSFSNGRWIVHKRKKT